MKSTNARPLSMLIFAAVIFARVGHGQVKPVPPGTPDTAKNLITSTVQATVFPVPPSWHEAVDGGAYKFTFTDPDNRFRCAPTAHTSSHPGNPLYDELLSVTFTCIRWLEPKPIRP